MDDAATVIETGSTGDGSLEPPLFEERLGVFRWDAFRLGVTGEACSGLEQIRTPRPLPRSPAHVLGVAHVRGKIVPIFDLGVALGLSLDPTSRHRPSLPIGLVVEVDDSTAVLAAEEIVTFEVFDMNQLSEVAETNPTTLRDFARGQTKHRGHDVVVLEIEALLDALSHSGLRNAADSSAVALTT